VLFAPFSFAGIGEAFGSQVRVFEDQAPNVRRPAVASAAGWKRVVIPDPATHPRLTFLAETVARMAAEHRGQVPVAVPLPSPVDLPALVMGLEAWLEAVLFEPALAGSILEDAIGFFVGLANGLFQAGAAFVVVPTGMTAPRVATRELVSSFAVPGLARAFSRLKGPVVLHHVGAPMLGTLDLLTGLPGVVGFAVDEADDPAQVRALIGPERVLFTGLTSLSLPALPPEEVERRCRVLLEGLRHDPRVVLYTTGADVPLATTPEQIGALRRAAEAVGWGAA